MTNDPDDEGTEVEEQASRVLFKPTFLVDDPEYIRASGNGEHKRIVIPAPTRDRDDEED